MTLVKEGFSVTVLINLARHNDSKSKNYNDTE